MTKKRDRFGGRARRPHQPRPLLDSSYRCDICGRDVPALEAKSPGLERVPACQRCLVADLRAVLRARPETFRHLPAARALLGGAAGPPPVAT